jgi:hypothetical protein
MDKQSRNHFFIVNFATAILEKLDSETKLEKTAVKTLSNAVKKN